MSNLYALDDVLYHLNTVTTIGIEQGCRDCVQVATALESTAARIAALEAENAALKQAAGALERLDTLPHEQYGEIFIGRNDLGRWNCIVYENLTHGDELVLDTVADEYADTLTAAIDAALKEVAGE